MTCECVGGVWGGGDAYSFGRLYSASVLWDDLCVLGLQVWHPNFKDKFAVDVVTRPVLPQESQTKVGSSGPELRESSTNGVATRHEKCA